MKPLDVAVFALIMLLSMALISDLVVDWEKDKRNTQYSYEEVFKAAVDDTGAYMSQLEAQQTESGIRYSKEKELNIDLEIINTFFGNLAMKLGVEGNPNAIQDLMLHVPAMAFVRYDGYNVVTLSHEYNSKGSSELYPTIHPLRPYTYELPTGNIIYFTLDNNMKLYDPSTNQYFEGTYEEVKAVRDLSPLTSVTKFEEARKKAVAKSIEEGLAGAVNLHTELIKNIGLTVKFNLPSDPVGDSIDNLGFYAFLQGYPLPGGELLTSYAFGGGQVKKRNEYAGVIRSDGRHVAYDVRCGVPPGSVVIENLYSDEEAARKGYFVEDCGL